MPIQIASAVTTGGVAGTILNYCNIPNPVIAIGGDLPWLHPDVPAPPNIFLTQLAGQIGYVPVIRRVPIVRQLNGDIAVSLDEAWQTLALDRAVLQQVGCRHVLIEAKVPHNLLPLAVTSYQSAGLYLETSVTTPALFTAGLVDGYLDLVQHFGIIAKANNALHVLRMIRQF
jgi:hypothetical protein